MRAELIRSFDRQTVPRDAVARFGGDPATQVHVGDSQNFVYRFRHRGGQEAYLRLTHDSHRTRELIEAELEFVAHLDAAGCPVAAPIPCSEGRFVHTLDTSIGPVHAAAFWAVHGQPVRWGNDAENRQILRERGRLLGQMHAVSQSFRPTGLRRFRYDEGDLFANPHAVLPPGESDPPLWAEHRAVSAYLSALPVDAATFGLIHGDLLSSNCLRTAGKSFAFDFDDCCYHFFAFDLAVAISAGRDLPEQYRRSYLQCLLDGYAEHRPLPANACEQITWFCRLSALYRYALYLGEMDPAAPTADQQQELLRRRHAVLEPVRWC